MLKYLSILSIYFVVGTFASEQKVLDSGLAGVLLKSLNTSQTADATGLEDVLLKSLNTSQTADSTSSFLSEVLSIDPKDISHVIGLLKKLAKQAASEISNLDDLLRKATADLKKKDSAYKDAKFKLDKSVAMEKKTKLAFNKAKQHHQDVVTRVNKEKPLLQKQLKVLNEVLRIISSIDPGSDEKKGGSDKKKGGSDKKKGCPKNSVYHKNYCYATMDYKTCQPKANIGDSRSCSHRCQRKVMTMPAGWEPVPATLDIRRNVVGKYRYGTHCVYLSNGRSYSTLARDRGGGGKFCDDKWWKSGNRYRARNCQRKVFMRTKAKNV